MRRGPALLLLLLALAAPARGGELWRLDPMAWMERSVTAAQRGDLSLARSLLEPVMISPRTSRALRARAYHYRGLYFYRDRQFRSASQDFRRALEFDPTYPAARNALGWLHLRGLGVQRDARRAVQLYRLAARQGHAEAQLNLAILLARGDGQRRDSTEALNWFQAAARQGSAEAAAQAGLLLRRGDPAGGLTADTRRALPWLRQAAEADHPRAQLELGLALSDPHQAGHDPQQALTWLRLAGSAGITAAYTRMGQLYSEGIGVDADADQALTWFREAAKLGDPDAQSHLGYFYDIGLAVAEDPVIAARWYRRAADRGDTSAQVNLAQLYRHGRGLDRDPERARYWLELASDAGDADARADLAWLLATAREDAVRDGARAIDLATSLVEQDPAPHHLDTLAAAYAEAGRFDAAVDAQRAALAGLDRSGDGASREAYSRRLANYLDAQPWRGDP